MFLSLFVSVVFLVIKLDFVSIFVFDNCISLLEFVFCFFLQQQHSQAHLLVLKHNVNNVKKYNLTYICFINIYFINIILVFLYV